MIEATAHFIWVGSQLPERFQKAIGDFQSLNESWSVRIWDEVDILDFGLTNEPLFLSPDQYVAPDARYQFMSDVARYEILYRLGGFYFDVDFKWQKPVEFLRDHQAVGAWEIQGRWVNNGMIGCQPEHPALGEMIDALPDNCERNRGKAATFLTGPRLWTPVALCNRVTIVEQGLFYPVPWDRPSQADTGQFPDAVAVHQWNHQREVKGLGWQA